MEYASDSRNHSLKLCCRSQSNLEHSNLDMRSQSRKIYQTSPRMNCFHHHSSAHHTSDQHSTPCNLQVLYLLSWRTLRCLVNPTITSTSVQQNVSIVPDPAVGTVTSLVCNVLVFCLPSHSHCRNDCEFYKLSFRLQQWWNCYCNNWEESSK